MLALDGPVVRVGVTGQDTVPNSGLPAPRYNDYNIIIIIAHNFISLSNISNI